MKNKALQHQLNTEVMALLENKKSIFLSSVSKDGSPHASYAPFAMQNDALFILISGLAAHTQNLLHTPNLSALIAEDESQCDDIFARLRVTYDLNAEVIDRDSEAWRDGVSLLYARFGERVEQISLLGDFVLFRLTPTKGRLVKGFGKAYDILGGTLAGEELVHISPKMLSNGSQL
ncbi:pyridoxamine 5'-phosphate oxidase family protein [Marinomonas algicola]|uniref:pyridoxamine 5'-phosphate oxidase family protein n=1 Tax=Marinomonas algicola TaxID=2773454 RepID=UPI0017497115|nr:pyridoxamine 5'-phosphate oxidase family protein [Marinomonas algicola]